MIKNINEVTEELKDSNGEEFEQVLNKPLRWYKKPYSAEAEVKKLKKQLQEKKDLLREIKKENKGLHREIWEQDELIEKLKGMLERVSKGIGDVIPG